MSFDHRRRGARTSTNKTVWFYCQQCLEGTPCLGVAPLRLERISYQQNKKNDMCFDRRRRRLGRPECLGVAPVGPEDAPRAGPERAGHGVVQRPGAASVRETILILVPRGTAARNECKT